MVDDKLATVATEAAKAPDSPASQLFWAYIGRQSFLELAFTVMMIYWAVYFVRVRKRRPELDPADFLTGEHGRFSLSKGGQALALVATTFGLLHMLVAGQLTEFYFTGYLAAWTGANAWARYTDAKISQARIEVDKPVVAPGPSVETTTKTEVKA